MYTGDYLDTAIAVRLFIDNGSSHTPHLGREPWLDPVVPSWVPIARVPAPDIEDPVLGLGTDGVLMSIQERVDAHICHQVDVVGMNKRQPPDNVVDPENRKLWDF